MGNKPKRQTFRKRSALSVTDHFHGGVNGKIAGTRFAIARTDVAITAKKSAAQAIAHAALLRNHFNFAVP